MRWLDSVRHGCRAICVVGMVAVALAMCIIDSAAGEEKPDYVPKLGEFPPPGSGGVFLAGELVAVDHVNRRGAIRLDGDLNDDRYHSAPSHRFAMLPFGSLRYHGAPADLRDIPIGTHLQGYFYRALEGDLSIPPPRESKYISEYTHAISLEDDFSFCQARGQSWKVVSVELNYSRASKSYKSGGLHKTPLTGKLKVVSVGNAASESLKGDMELDIDRSTRLWKGRSILDWEDLAPEKDWTRKDNVVTFAVPEAQSVQLNVAWSPEWRNHHFQCADLWLDEQSQNTAAEQQRQLHIRYEHNHWMAGWIDSVEHESGGSGIITFTLFAGCDPSLYDEIHTLAKPGASGFLAAAEFTLRTWWQDNDSKGGSVVELKEIPSPRPGSSGIQIRLRVREIIEGFRPSRIIRFRPSSWPLVKLPPEERIQNMEDRERMQMGLGSK